MEDEIFIRNSSTESKSRVLSFDADSGVFKRIVLELPGSVPSTKAKEVWFTGALGEQVQGWLRLPEGKGPFSTILEVHGGPFSFDGCKYESNAFIDHGFAKLSINYHGSATFGEPFRKSIIGRVGELELEDMVAARNWLVDQGIAIPDQIFLTGGSYGGYLTLWGMVRRPDLWAGGMASVPIADWVSKYEDESGWLKSLTIEEFCGTPDEKPELYKKSSPITYVENLKVPLLIIAGKNDTRCPRRQNEEFIQKAKELGKDIEEYWYNEGHGLSAVDEQIYQMELRLKFLKRVLEK